MNAVVFGKTKTGHDEIQQRTLRLHPRLRSVLVVVDGKHSVEGLLKTLAPMGVTVEHFEQLRDLGLIEAIVTEQSPAEPIPEAAAPAAAPESGHQNPSEPEVVPSDDAGRMLVLYRIFNETIRTSFGIRGFGYQMTLERADSLEDYVNLANDILRALEKSKGGEVASNFKSRVKPYFA